MTTQVMRFDERLPFVEPTAFVVDLGRVVDETFERRLLFAEHLSKFRSETPLFAVVDGVEANHQDRLLKVPSAGIFARRWGQPLLAVSVASHLDNLTTHHLPETLPAPYPTVLMQQLQPHLTKRQLALLTLLMQNQGRVVGREELIAVGWQGREKTNIRIVDYAIFRLRQRIGNALNLDGLIRTVKNRGYRFHAAAQEHPGASQRDINPRELQLVLIEGDEVRAQPLLDAARQERLNLVRWSVGDPSVARVDLAFQVADANREWLETLYAFLLQHPGASVLVCDNGADPTLLARAATLPRVCLCRLSAPFATFGMWWPWALQRIGFHGAQDLAPLTMVPNLQGVRLQGVLYHLAPKSYAVLSHLHDLVDRPVSREQLQLAVWGGRLAANSRSLDMRVSGLRALLRKHFAAGPPSIETLPGLGYRLRLQ